MHAPLELLMMIFTRILSFLESIFGGLPFF